ncbi:MAG: N-acetylmuramic acid 6-phosphate etherase [Fimbriimonadales bacterium]|nr:MAG: N-acetylmuramic acid 6-phosphate etherase [Fimbriimonadales bacterium]
MRTEEHHPRRLDLTKISPRELVQIVTEESHEAARAVANAADALVRAIEEVARCYDRGGTTIYVGAGTSGRIAAMDAAEMPPTFGVPPERFVALVAGGAFMRSAEGAEDNREQARRDLDNVLRHIGPGEMPLHAEATPPGAQSPHLVIGVSASGATPYVLAAIELAKERNIFTIGIANNPHVPLVHLADHAVVLDTGPEILAGSTRMKAGTAQKIALNIISLGAMAMCGRVEADVMTHMTPVSDKLRQRAIRIVMTQRRVNAETARRILEQCGWVIARALSEEADLR